MPCYHTLHMNVFPFHNMEFHSITLYSMLWNGSYDMPCHAMPCHAMPDHVRCRRAMLCEVMDAMRCDAMRSHAQQAGKREGWPGSTGAERGTRRGDEEDLRGDEGGRRRRECHPEVADQLTARSSQNREEGSPRESTIPYRPYQTACNHVYYLRDECSKRRSDLNSLMYPVCLPVCLSALSVGADQHVCMGWDEGRHR
jgi:hypothetical protein